MNRKQNPNLEILEQAVTQLGPLADELVFLGGCATGLLITDPAAPPLRVTRDVDAIVQVMTRSDYYQFTDRLKAQGFKECVEDGAPLCRWVSGSIILDVMPVETRILGFGNRWYQSAAEQSRVVALPSGKTIQMITAPYFLITKLEAFDGRGKGDYLASQDIEDLVAVLDGRREIIDEVRLAPSDLVKAIVKRFKSLKQERQFIDAVSGHMPTDATSQARVQVVLGIIDALSDI